MSGAHLSKGSCIWRHKLGSCIPANYCRLSIARKAFPERKIALAGGEEGLCTWPHIETTYREYIWRTFRRLKSDTAPRLFVR